MQFHYGTRDNIIKGLNLRGLDRGFGMKFLGYHFVMNANFNDFE